MRVNPDEQRHQRSFISGRLRVGAQIYMSYTTVEGAAEIWEGKWVKDADSEVFMFWALVSIFGLVLVVKRPPKLG